MQIPTAASSARPLPTVPYRHWLLLLTLLVGAQALLLLNPGYFSHDELQWAAQADVATWRSLPWERWFATDVFQYRPLTFNTWLLLSHALFEHPHAFHAVWVLLGSCNGLLLARLLIDAGVAARVAAVAALVFVLNPYATYVHGWVATLADLLWVGLALGLAIVLQRRVIAGGAGGGWCGDVLPFLLALLVTGLALLAKEAALVIPGLLLLAGLWSTRRRVWLVAAGGAATVAAFYLALRLGPVLHGARPGSGYGLALSQLPLRWLEYQLYPWVPTLFEIQSLLLASTARLAAVGGVLVALLVALWRAGPRYALAWCVGGTAALGPVLVLAQSANQYGYGFSALAVGVVAMAWPRMRRVGRVLVAVTALLAVWHGVNVQRAMLRAGELQARFSPSVAVEVATLAAGEILRLHVANPSDAWLYARLTHAVPSYGGVPLGDRVQLVPPDAAADARIEADGHVRFPQR